MTSRSAFNGPRRKLVLAFDVGTTYSGISYSVLDPGQVPEIKGVTRFPAHEHISGASKIPTIIYYDRNGKVQAVGAEAMRDGVYEQAQDEEWDKAEWFKLHLRSRIGPGAGTEVSEDIPALPTNKTVIDVFADFLAYLLKCASSYIQDTHMNGVNLWASVKDEIDFVLSHPNGWEGTQQSEMRKAAVLAGLVPDTIAGHARLSFITEGEACLHFAIQNGLSTGAIKQGDGVVIVDAGGGTIDISSYSGKTSGSTMTFEEVAAPQCHFHGSVFVNIHARLFLGGYLADSSFADDVEHIVRCFDKTTKLRFRDAEEPQYIKFGGTRDNDVSYGIRFGQLKLLGSDVATFFEPSIDCIIDAVLDQTRTAHKPISHVVLVGGFAASDYMFNKVHAALTPSGLNIVRPENHVNKAVSDGAISFYFDHFVQTRVSKVTYGCFHNPEFNPDAPDHRERSSQAYIAPDGVKRLPYSFDVILPKNTQVSETTEFRRSYRWSSNSRNLFNAMSFSVWCYRGLMGEPKWRDVDTKNYTNLCSIAADLSHLHLMPMKKLAGEGTYYRLQFDVVLLFVLTELKAQIAWKEGGIEKRSEAQIVYDPDTTNDE
ncbi:hypothetical protein BJ912DRAFT_1061935 [Pholiota molesta]|nr:hypothetical protein BJ912DRAFT_1061935 [Pholiota molesta]